MVYSSKRNSLNSCLFFSCEQGTEREGILSSIMQGYMEAAKVSFVVCLIPAVFLCFVSKASTCEVVNIVVTCEVANMGERICDEHVVGRRLQDRGFRFLHLWVPPGHSDRSSSSLYNPHLILVLHHTTTAFSNVKTRTTPPLASALLLLFMHEQHLLMYRSALTHWFLHLLALLVCILSLLVHGPTFT